MVIPNQYHYNLAKTPPSHVNPRHESYNTLQQQNIAFCLPFLIVYLLLTKKKVTQVLSAKLFYPNIKELKLTH